MPRLKKISLYFFAGSLFFLLFGLAAFFSPSVLAADDGTVNLEIHTIDETVKTRVRVAGRTTPGASVKMYVNGADQGKVKVGKKGRISKWVVLDVIGSNEILVTAEKEAETSSLTRFVMREAVRAVDRSLGVEIIKCKNRTKNSVLQIDGMAEGVSQVQILVNDFEWGWAVVNHKSGKYTMKVRLTNGMNTVEVVASTDDDSVTATKDVLKY